MGNSLAISYKARNVLTFNSVNSTPGFLSKKTKSIRPHNIFSKMLIIALCVIARKEKWIKYLSADAWINNLWIIHISIKRNKSWNDLKWPQKCYVKWKKPDTKENILYYSIHLNSTGELVYKNVESHFLQRMVFGKGHQGTLSVMEMFYILFRWYLHIWIWLSRISTVNSEINIAFLKKDTKLHFWYNFLSLYLYICVGICGYMNVSINVHSSVRTCIYTYIYTYIAKPEGDLLKY